MVPYFQQMLQLLSTNFVSVTVSSLTTLLLQFGFEEIRNRNTYVLIESYYLDASVKLPLLVVVPLNIIAIFNLVTQSLKMLSRKKYKR